jgi:hypothetical protein
LISLIATNFNKNILFQIGGVVGSFVGYNSPAFSIKPPLVKKKGSFTLAKFFGKNIRDFTHRLCHPYMPWSPWVFRHK